MQNALLIFTVTFIQALIATLEVASIARGRMWRAGVLAGLNALAYCVVVIILIVDVERWHLVPWYVGANALATVLGTWMGRRRNGIS
uniref:Uncharacterized protein n=1 Tax=viral metagenome TaxID=1070528 RepID=A0A6M3K015_9ZZZZ